jgi:tripartite-type tricarboxylate transporter receptor subunit TctC
VPTVHEAEAPGFEAAGWQGIPAPAGTPEPILAQLDAAIGAALREGGLPQACLAQGQIPTFLPRTTFADLIRRARGQWTQVVYEAGVTLG